jgi:hypothetical protein
MPTGRAVFSAGRDSTPWGVDDADGARQMAASSRLQAVWFFTDCSIRRQAAARSDTSYEATVSAADCTLDMAEAQGQTTASDRSAEAAASTQTV